MEDKVEKATVKQRLGQLLSKRSVKLLFLLFTAIVISTASTTVYYALLSSSSVTTAEAVVHFTAGGDSTAAGYSAGTNETYAQLTSLKAYPNVTLTYEQAMNVTNTDTSSHQIRLRHVSISPSSGDSSVGNFTQIDFKLVDKSGTVQATLTYTTTGDTWNTPSPTSYVSIPASTQWAIRVETKAVAGAKKSIACSIEIAVDVQ
ncbi:hypothetical protein DRO42_00525 [Candidatus Bathyarchaeota archaeon]|nr:MAG: hypothetical protein DRO42_00525 [Candidatus Bathyarchaeota archaeon]